jgi:hypothetical protein
MANDLNMLRITEMDVLFSFKLAAILKYVSVSLRPGPVG